VREEDKINGGVAARVRKGKGANKTLTRTCDDDFLAQLVWMGFRDGLVERDERRLSISKKNGETHKRP